MVVDTEAPSAHSGGVSLFYLTVEHFSVESFQAHGVDIVRFQMVVGDRRWYIAGCYLDLDVALTI